MKKAVLISIILLIFGIGAKAQYYFGGDNYYYIGGSIGLSFAAKYENPEHPDANNSACLSPTFEFGLQNDFDYVGLLSCCEIGLIGMNHEYEELSKTFSYKYRSIGMDIYYGIKIGDMDKQMYGTIGLGLGIIPFHKITEYIDDEQTDNYPSGFSIDNIDYLNVFNFFGVIGFNINEYFSIKYKYYFNNYTGEVFETSTEITHLSRISVSAIYPLY